MVDCEKFSPSALEFFKKFEPFFPPDPWGKPQWEIEGRVYDNGWLDMKKSADRTRLEKKTLEMIGYFARINGKNYLKERGSLEDFSKMEYGKAIEKYVELLIILDDLDFQIETMDLIE